MNYLALCELSVLLERTSKRLQKTALLAEFLRDVPLDELPCVILLVQGLVYPSWDVRKLGFSSQYVLRALASSAGVSVDAVKDLWREKGDLGHAGRDGDGLEGHAVVADGVLDLEVVLV